MTSIVRMGLGVGVGAGSAVECWKEDGSRFVREFWRVMVLMAAAPSRRRKVRRAEGKVKRRPGLLWRDRGDAGVSEDPRDGSLGYFRETQLRGSTSAHAGSFGGEWGGTAAVEVEASMYFGSQA